MMEKLPIFEPEPIRPDLVAPEILDKEIWQPNWKCFCCEDTGLIQNLWLIKKVMPNYKPGRDKMIACQKPRCEAGWNYRANEQYDQRFLGNICAELDRLNRKDWEATVLTQWEAAKNRQLLENLAAGKSVRQRDRTLTEEQQTQRRHGDLIAADFKKEKAKKEEEDDDWS